MLLRSGLFRRVMACVLALSFDLYTAEALLPDAHDGDATHEELVKADGAGEHAVFRVSHGDASSAAHAGAQAETPDDHPGERAPGLSGHGQHSCHHAHVHGDWLQARLSQVAKNGARRTQPVTFGDQAPASRIGEPLLRPPMA